MSTASVAPAARESDIEAGTAPNNRDRRNKTSDAANSVERRKAEKTITDYSKDYFIGLAVIAYAYTPQYKIGYLVKLLPLLLLAVQVTSPFLIWIPQLDELAATAQGNSTQPGIFEGTLCPGGASTSARITMLLIAFIYVYRATINAVVLWNSQDMLSIKSPLLFYGMFDFFLMQVIYEVAVYMLNLWLILLTENPLDMVLNSVALEFITQLDTEFKAHFFENFPAINEHIHTLNTKQVRSGNSTGLNIFFLLVACVVGLAQIAVFPALVAMMIYGPLCKPVGHL